MKLAIDGGTAVRTKPWPSLHQCDTGDQVRVNTVLQQNNWSNGALCREFEQTFAKYCGSRHAILTTNGTAAIEIALSGCGIGPGDEVIVPAMTWPSVALAVMKTGANPVPADIELDTFAISPRTIEQAISPQSRAIIATHLFCSQADMCSIKKIAHPKNIRIIEDGTQSVGARQNGRTVGSLGDVGVFSFNQKKLLACGEGGGLITDDESIYLRSRAVYDVDPGIGKIPVRIPETYRPSEFHAAVLLGQLEKLPSRLKIVEERGRFLKKHLETDSRIKVLRRIDGTEIQSYYNFCFRIIGHPNIEWFRKALSEEISIPISGGYIPLSCTSIVNTSLDARFRHLGSQLQKRLPNALTAHYKEAVRFPYNVLLANEEDILQINEAVRKILDSPIPPAS